MGRQDPSSQFAAEVSFGGLDSFKDELWFMTGRGALQRGFSVLLMDGPGQGATLRRQGLTTRFDYEVPAGKCIDWLATRSDVDMSAHRGVGLFAGWILCCARRRYGAASGSRYLAWWRAQPL
jgi:hypothetical protein